MKKLAIVFMTMLFVSGVFISPAGPDSTDGSFVPGGGGGGDKCYHPKQC